jgi:hypothetical protein
MNEPIPPPLELFEWLQPYSEEVQDLFMTARDFAVARAPDANEFVVDSTNAVAMGLGYTRKFMDNFIHIAAYAKYVNLGFDYGINLDDPERRLVGNGARVRHLRLTTTEDLADPYIVNLFEQAHANAVRPAAALPRTTMLMPYKGTNKRRPAG